MAALGILGWHQLGFSLDHPLLGHAFKGVGLFFMISGFVLSHRYEERLKAGLSAWTFAALRLARLYPLYLAGTLLGCALGLAGLGYVAPTDGLRALPGALALWPGALNGQEILFPLDAPAWSLYLEVLASLAYGFLLPALSDRVIILAVAGGFLVMESQLLQFGTLDLGWDRATFAAGLARVLYGFPAGVLLQRWWRRGWLRTSAYPLSRICLIFLLVIALPPAGALNPAMEVVISAVIWPLLVILAVNARASSRETRFACALGERSYALYALHFPVLVAFHRIAGPPGTPRAMAAGVFSFVVAWGLASAATRFIDAPIRRALRGGAPETRPGSEPGGLAQA